MNKLDACKVTEKCVGSGGGEANIDVPGKSLVISAAGRWFTAVVWRSFNAKELFDSVLLSDFCLPSPSEKSFL